MIASLRSISIRWKVALLILVTCSITLATSVTLQVYSSWKEALSAQHRSIEIAAKTIGRDCASALLFFDDTYATGALEGLSHEESARAAAIFDAAGEPFASWTDRRKTPTIVPGQFAEGEQVLGSDLVVTRPIKDDGNALGWIVIRSDLGVVRANVYESAVRSILLALIGLGVSAILAALLSMWIARPILHLTRTARSIEETEDFSLRAAKDSADELGELVDSFNTMLGRVQERDRKLQQHQEHLESEVEKRTSELVLAKDHALDAARSKADFLANMSHEIRTPMNGVIGMTGLILDTEITDDQKDMLETIRSCGDQLLTLINDILDFSKIESGKMALEEIDFNLRSVIEDMGDIFGARYQERGVELLCMVHSSLPVCLKGDPSRLRQVLTNLLGNALKFTAEGEVQLSVNVVEEREGEVQLAIAVRDTGIGIPTDRLESLFEAFTQVDASTTRKFGGTGLGLSISGKLARLMGGEIVVTSVEGEGSTFTVNIPFRTQAEPVELFAADEAVLKGMRVAVLDDNATNRKILAHQLESWGCSQTSFSTPKDAIAKLTNRCRDDETPDLVLLDYLMDDMNGLEVCRALREEEHMKDVPIMLLTSVSFGGRKEELASAGASGQLTKPIKLSQLKKHILTVLGLGKSAPGSPQRVVLEGQAADPIEPKQSRILLVEDNAINQRIGVALLKKAGYKCEIANDGQEAVDTVSKMPFDLILMDCQMPVLDGYEATQVIRRREARTGGFIPIIAMTANAMEGDREKCLAAGMDDYITKPVVSEQLYEKLAFWLNSGRRADKSA